MSIKVIANSGGATSGYMTWRMLPELTKDDLIIFCNTGKEREETLQFLKMQEIHWGIKIIWLEYCFWNKWKQVTYETAARNGEPFEAVMWKYGHTPNNLISFCSRELKERTTKRYLRSMGIKDHVQYHGIRYDEPRRFKDSEHVKYPLFKLKITKKEIEAFWQTQEFRLQLLSYQGNCDFCFKKSQRKIKTLLNENPAAAQWWIDVETAYLFPMHRYSLTQMSQYVSSIGELPFDDDNDLNSLNCYCTN